MCIYIYIHICVPICIRTFVYDTYASVYIYIHTHVSSNNRRVDIPEMRDIGQSDCLSHPLMRQSPVDGTNGVLSCQSSDMTLPPMKAASSSHLVPKVRNPNRFV